MGRARCIVVRFPVPGLSPGGGTVVVRLADSLTLTRMRTQPFRWRCDTARAYNPVPNVRVFSPNPVLTDQFGSFRVEAVPPGEYAFYACQSRQERVQVEGQRHRFGDVACYGRHGE